MKNKTYNFNGQKYNSIHLEKSEYAKIVSEINTNYSKYKGQKIAMHKSLGIDGNYYIYMFENFGFNNYRFLSRKLMD